MLIAQPDPVHLWCVWDTRAGRYVARRITETAAIARVDVWVREHATQLREATSSEPAEAITPDQAWQRAAVVAWSHTEGEWIPLVVVDGQQPVWVPPDRVRLTR